MTSDETHQICTAHNGPPADCAHIKHGVKHDCGFIEDTFACKIRHLQINTGDADSRRPRWDRAQDLHNNKFG